MLTLYRLPGQRPLSGHPGACRALTAEQVEERFSTDGLAFNGARAVVDKGAADEKHVDASDELEAPDGGA